MAATAPTPQAPAKKPPASQEMRGRRARRYYANYRSHAASVRSAGRQIAAQAPGTDTFGAAFKVLTVAGLIGLGVLHPEMVANVLNRATNVITTVIRGASK